MIELGLLIVALACGVFSNVLIGILGSRRRIGFFWAFFWSLVLTPFIGLIITLISDPLPVGDPKRIGCLGSVLGVVGMLILLWVVAFALLCAASIVVL